MNYLIDFTQDSTDESINEYLSRNNCSTLSIFNNFEKVYLVSCEIDPPVESIVTSVINDSETSIIPLYDNAVSIDSYDVDSIDVEDDKNWWKVVSCLHVDFSQPEFSLKKYGKKITVYVLDSGVDLSHPEFEGQDVSQIYTFNGNSADVNGHGTAIASLITGKTVSLTSAKVVSLKIFEEGVPTPLSKLIEALDIIYTHSQDQLAAIVNISWGIPYNEYVNNKIKLLHLSGNVRVLAAAGNDGSPISNVTPACISEVYVVGAFNKDLVPCDFSNYTSDLYNTTGTVNYGALDIWAPGENIYVALPGGGYGFVSGTSFSAAIHSSAVAADLEICYSINSTSLIPLKNVVIDEMFVSGFATSRPNILDLSGMYSSSVNLITCFYPIDKFSRLSQVPEKIRLIAGTLDCAQLLTPMVCKSVRLLTDLPEGLSLSEYGWIIGTAPLLPEGQLYQSYPLSAEFTLNDDTVITRDLDFYIVTRNLSDSEVPEELLWITPYLINCTTNRFTQCFGPRCPFANNRLLRYCQNLDVSKNGSCEYCCMAANCCFTPDTKISMADGKEKAIKDVIEGEEVLVYDTDNNTFGVKPVRCVITRTERPMYKITFSDGTFLEASEDHPLFVVGKGYSSIVPPEIYKDLKSIGTISIGDRVLSVQGRELEITDIEKIDFSDTVYEFDTSGFFANGILVY